jgi:hypothetical protein
MPTVPSVGSARSTARIIRRRNSAIAAASSRGTSDADSGRTRSAKRGASMPGTSTARPAR